MEAEIAVFEPNTPRFDKDVIVGPVIFPVELIVPETSNLYAGLRTPIPIKLLLFTIPIPVCPLLIMILPVSFLSTMSFGTELSFN